MTIHDSPNFVAPVAPTGRAKGVEAGAVKAKPVQTRWGGYYFRSRLEARWAVALNALGVKWTYEPQGHVVGGRAYLCDYWLPEHKVWAEVKPAFDEDAYKLLGRLVEATDCRAGFLLCGLDDLQHWWWVKPEGRLGWWTRRSEHRIRRRALFQLDPHLHGFMPDGHGRVIWSPLLWLAGGDRKLLAQAVTAARSARFEHGEKP